MKTRAPKPSLLFKSLLLTLMLASPSLAQAHEPGTWLLRSRAIYIGPITSTDGVGTTGALAVGVRSEGTPEFDFSYFITKDISAELILGMARHQVTLNGGNIGSVNVLPPTLNFQYHFKDLLGLSFDPYLGAGMNLTFFFNTNLLASGVGKLEVSGTSFGPSFQTGADIPLKGDVFLNVDCKKIMMKTDVLAAGTALNTLHIDPWVFGLGIGLKL